MAKALKRQSRHHVGQSVSSGVSLIHDAIDSWYAFPFDHKLKYRIIVLIVTLLLPQVNERYMCL